MNIKNRHVAAATAAAAASAFMHTCTPVVMISSSIHLQNSDLRNAAVVNQEVVLKK